MLTDYLVHCPHVDCGWRGCLFPRGSREAWKPALPTVQQVTFECPRCRSTWQARIVGDDAVPVPDTLQVPVTQNA
jgi:hypothetical protein